MNSQITDTIFMVRPWAFGYNTETAMNNSFQSVEGSENKVEIQEAAVQEFDKMVDLLRSVEVEVIVKQDPGEPYTPDSIFPNNWISFHGNEGMITYPMFAPNRRKERREDYLNWFEENFRITRRYSFEYYEEKNSFLEGTGSMVLDRVNRIVYACISPRTDPIVLEKFCVLNNYSKVPFSAVDSNGDSIYHTNVMMAVADDYAVVCLDSIPDELERQTLEASLQKTGKEIIKITYAQVEKFAGNMLQIKNKWGRKFLVMSEQAYYALGKPQIDRLKSYNELLTSDISTIEKYGGGSVRCMMCEVFVKRKKLP